MEYFNIPIFIGTSRPPDSYRDYRDYGTMNSYETKTTPSPSADGELN